MIEGLFRIPLRRFEDERGWFCELNRESLLPKRTVQTNVSFSRRGTLRGLHYHERGQDDVQRRAHAQGEVRLLMVRRTGDLRVADTILDQECLHCVGALLRQLVIIRS